MKTFVWILGKGGMLGSRTARFFEEQYDWELWDDCEHLEWNSSEVVQQQLRTCINAFSKVAHGRHWMILWMAGSGFVGSSEETLQKETQTWKFFLETLSTAKPSGNGVLFFSSSAGTIYGQAEDILTEESSLAPVSPYGKEKMRQEELLRSFADGTPNVSTIIGRISNLYGEEQNLLKSQGIISHLVRHALFKKPLHLYVPLGTIRDYVYVGDCVRAIIDVLVYVEKNPQSQPLVKLFVSERVTTIAELLKHLHMITKRTPLITRGNDMRSAVNIRSMRFHSKTNPVIPMPQETSLLTGIHRVYQYQHRLFAQGLLPAP